MRKMLADSLPAGRSQMRLAYLPPHAAAAAAFADSDGVQLALGVGTSACSPLSPDEPERAPSATAAADLEVAVDNIMLKLAINEILLNASAYSQHQATISCAAIYFDQSPLPPSYMLISLKSYLVRSSAAASAFIKLSAHDSHELVAEQWHAVRAHFGRPPRHDESQSSACGCVLPSEGHAQSQVHLHLRPTVLVATTGRTRC